MSQRQTVHSSTLLVRLAFLFWPQKQNRMHVRLYLAHRSSTRFEFLFSVTDSARFLKAFDGFVIDRPFTRKSKQVVHRFGNPYPVLSMKADEQTSPLNFPFRWQVVFFGLVRLHRRIWQTHLPSRSLVSLSVPNRNRPSFRTEKISYLAHKNSQSAVSVSRPRIVNIKTFYDSLLLED